MKPSPTTGTNASVFLPSGQAIRVLTAGPTWLSLADDGVGNTVLVGTPQAGAYPFTVRATDNNPSAPAATAW